MFDCQEACFHSTLAVALLADFPTRHQYLCRMATQHDEDHSTILTQNTAATTGYNNERQTAEGSEKAPDGACYCFE